MGEYSNRYTLHIDPNFSPAQVKAITVAAEDIERETGVKYDIVVEHADCGEMSSDYNTCIRASYTEYVASRCNAIGASGCTEHTYAGSSANANSDIAVNHPQFNVGEYGEEYVNALFSATVSHEMLHALGLDHVTDPGALMYPMTGPSKYQAHIGRTGALTSLTCSDFAQYQALRGLKSECLITK